MDFHDPEAARCRKNTPKKQRKYTAGETRRKIGGKSFSRKKVSVKSSRLEIKHSLRINSPCIEHGRFIRRLFLFFWMTDGLARWRKLYA